MKNHQSVTQYDWAMYVDAAGDDGFAFERGSSETYTVNCFMCETKHIDYNKNILSEIKKAIRCNKNCEVKSATIVKSKKRSEICKMLSTLNGVVLQLVIFKRSLKEDSLTEEDRAKHIFSSFAHSFTINMASTFHHHFKKSLCIIVDNMKSAEIIGTKEGIKKNLSDVRHTILFADSKSSEHSLLQISDFFAGLSNRAFINHERAIREKPSLTRCSPCNVRRALCRYKPHQIQTELFYDIQKYVNLFAIWSDKRADTVIGNGIILAPICYENRYRFFDCTMHVNATYK